MKMLQAGCDVLLESGLDVSVEMLSLEELIQIARVSRSAVYRMWDKDAFIDELLCYVAGPDGYFGGGELFDRETVDVVHKAISDNRHLLDTASGRHALLREAVRVGAGQNFRAQFSPQARIHTALMAAVRSSKNLHDRSNIAVAIEEAEMGSQKHITELIKFVMTTLGFRMRDRSMTVEQLQIIGASTLQGLAIRQDVSEAAAEQWRNTHDADVDSPHGSIVNPVFRPGLDGQPVEWTLAALAYIGVVDGFVELDPNFDYSEHKS